MEKIKPIRDSQTDNIKGLLIFLVIFGHFISNFISKSDLANIIYSTIYVFHMPIFIFLNGLYGKKFSIKSVLNLLAVYIVWQAIIYPIGVHIFSGTYQSNLHFPQWAYWYMISLACWKLISRFIPRNYLILLLSIIVSLAINIFDLDPNSYSLVRTVVLYPFYYFGLIMDKEKISLLACKIPKTLAILSLALIVFTVYIIFHEWDISTRVLHYKYPYLEYADSIKEGVMLRILLMGLAFMSIFTIFRLLTNDKTILSKWGVNSFIIYITHPIILRSLSKAIKLPADEGVLLNFMILGLIFTFGFCELLSGRVGKKNKFTHFHN